MVYFFGWFSDHIFLNYLFFYLYVYVFLCVYVCVHKHICVGRGVVPKEARDPLEIVTDGCVLPNLGHGNQTQVFSKRGRN